MMGVVLCGGQSSRMGKDKGLLQYQSTSWAQLAAEKLKQVQLHVVVSVNAQQYDAYRNLFQNLIVVIDANTLDIAGPLKGILSVHAQQPKEDLLILACDMRDMQPEVLEQLIVTNFDSDVEAVVFKNGDTIEPLCGIYTAKGLHKVYEQYRHGLLKKFSMQSVLQALDTIYLSVPENRENCFRNFNTAADLGLV
jgi:molybdenum cofactor guanylyltransferase